MVRLMAALMAAFLACTAEAGEIEQKRHEEVFSRAEAERQHAAMQAEEIRRREADMLARRLSERSQSASQPQVTDAIAKKYDPCSVLILAVIAEWNDCDKKPDSGLAQAKNDTDPSQRRAEDGSSSLSRGKASTSQALERRRQIGALRARKAVQRSRTPRGSSDARVIHRSSGF